MGERTVGCSFSGCERDHYARGFCRLHYKRSVAGISHSPCVMCGGPTPKAGAKYCGRSCRMRWHRKFGCYRPEVMRESVGECSVVDCGQAIHADNLCRAHYMRKWRHGSELAPVRSFGATHCVKCGAERPRKGSGKNMCLRCYHNSYYHENVETERPRRNARR